MRVTTRLSPILLLALSCFAGRAAVAELIAPRPFAGMTRSELTPERMEEIVRTAYRRTSAYMANGGARVRFRLHDFQTLEPREWDTIRYLDVADFAEGWVIDVHRAGRSHQEPGLSWRRRSYESKWREHPDLGWLQLPENAWILTANVSEAFALMAEGNEDAELARTFALTTYGVEVTFAGRERRYQAVVLWHTADRGAGFTFRFLDHITQGVAAALLEDVPPEGIVLDERPSLHRFLRNLRAKSGTAECEASTIVDATFKQGSGENGHSTGRHEAYVGIRNECSCDVACTSKCRGGFEGFDCADMGFTSKCHVLATGHDAGSGTVFGATGGGAACAAGFGCAQRSCLGCGCGLSMTVSAPGASVSFSSSSTAEWTAQLPHTTLCAPCDPLPDEPPPDEDEQPPPWGTPILIDLDKGGFGLTSLAGGVWFDIDADGVRERVSWTEETGREAFLAMDRNSNFSIDDGSELFGDATTQPASPTPNSYLALARYDRPEMSGNGDGKISAEDSIFAWLQLWVDGNHDGVSQPNELVPVSKSGSSPSTSTTSRPRGWIASAIAFGTRAS